MNKDRLGRHLGPCLACSFEEHIFIEIDSERLQNWEAQWPSGGRLQFELRCQKARGRYRLRFLYAITGAG